MNYQMNDISKILLKRYFEYNNLVKQQIDSYNRFVQEGMREYLENKMKNRENEIEVELGNRNFMANEDNRNKIVYKIVNIKLEPPMKSEQSGNTFILFPAEALMRDLTYSGRVLIDVERYIRKYDANGNYVDEFDGKEENIHIGDLPVMVNSVVCNLNRALRSNQERIYKGTDPMDPGGYFIINGTERTLIGIEDLVPNKILVVKENKEDVIAKVFSTRGIYRAKLTIRRTDEGLFYIDFPHSVPQLNVFVVIRALGMSDEEIQNALKQYPEAYFDYMLNKQEIEKKEDFVADPLVYLIKRLKPNNEWEVQLNHFNKLMSNFVLPHLGTDVNPEINKKKAKYLLRMCMKASLLAYNKIKEDDRDHYGNKRVKLAGDLIAELFGYAFDQLIADTKNQINKSIIRGRRVIKFSTLIRPNVFTTKVMYALATGNWIAGQTGVSQVMDRVSFVSSLSHRRRILSPLDKSHPHFKARDLHGTWYGKICPSETPEGASTSLLKNMAIMAEITTEKVDVTPILAILNPYLTDSRSEHNVQVYLDGDYIGEVKNGKELFDALVSARRAGEISSSVNFYFREEFNEFYINTSPGRLRRPYLVIERGELKILRIWDEVKSGKYSWEQLVKMGYIEYLDAEEEENAFIAKSMNDLGDERYTHMEIDPSTLFGIAAALLPFPEYNSSPRLTMASGMLKQSLGIYNSAFNFRYDTKAYINYYNERPIATTRTYDYLGLAKRAAGYNLVVAVMSYRGWNMTDAIVINKSAVDRGFGRSIMFKTYSTEIVEYYAQFRDKITKPGSMIMNVKHNVSYEKLDDDGLPRLEEKYVENDVIIGKLSPPRFLEDLDFTRATEEKYKDSSIKVKEGEEGRVDRVMITENQDGEVVIKVRFRLNKIPEIGDKFSSRHGQKGVIGMLVDQKDLPFTKSGIVPDLIINPHAIPSRMTAGHLLEMLGCKAACITGKYVDATPFSGDKLEKFVEELKSLGFDEWGEEEMYDGITGEKIKVKIFIGVIYYQRLHHLVSNKMHSRTKGPVQLLTSQPTEGRSREGGLRFGEMERDTLLGYGAAATVIDRLLENSDKHVEHVCLDCGSFAYYDEPSEEYVCPVCGSNNIGHIEIPYAFKLLLNEIISMHIYPKLFIRKKGDLDDEQTI
ncbi:MAG: DNA-directed RNA polymerase subunit B [Candidatus Anstonellales archaeon]